MKKKILFLLSLVMLVSLTVPAFAEEPDYTSGTPGPNIDLEGSMTEEMAADVKDSSSLDIKQAKIDFYFFDIENKESHSVYFINGSDVPYFALSDWPAVAGLVHPDNEVPGLVFSMADNAGVLTREDGYYVTFDCDADVIHFLDYDAFMRFGDDNVLIDMVGNTGTFSDGSVRYLHCTKNSYERYGKEVSISTGDYNIDIISENGECYVPLQTLSDILMAFRYVNIYYNGEIAVIGPPDVFGRSDNLTPLGELYYSVEPHDRSETMARFAYDELCLAMDTFYGLKESHDIESFDELADDTGLKPALTGTDPVQADAALYQLLELHLDDSHTAFRLSSPLSGIGAGDSFPKELGEGQCDQLYNQQFRIYAKAAMAVYHDHIPCYEEFGNTAFITIIHFEDIPDDVDYYENPPTQDVRNAIGIMLYAYQQITRKNSPIENVVLDLSLNRGGQAISAVYTLAAFLGTGSISIRNALSGSLVTGNYQADMNLDSKIDELDLGLTDKNLSCLESPISFSCSNLVTNEFKHSNIVTLIGRSSGGGTCFVQSMSTAYGSCFQISGPMQMSFLKNGSFYSNDQGAEPDFQLIKPSSFYDHQALAEFINTLR